MSANCSAVLSGHKRMCMLLANMVLNCMKRKTRMQQLFTYWDPGTSKSPILVCSLSFLLTPNPCLTPAVCPCFTVAMHPPPASSSSSLLLAAWGTDFAADKAASAAGRAKQYPGAHCSTAYATKHGWRQPKGQAPRDISAGVYVSVWCVCHLYPLPLSISIRRICLVFTHGWFKKEFSSNMTLRNGFMFFVDQLPSHQNVWK